MPEHDSHENVTANGEGRAETRAATTTSARERSRYRGPGGLAATPPLGNAATGVLVQRRARVGAVHDPAEHEADAVASDVVAELHGRTTAPDTATTGGPTAADGPLIARRSPAGTIRRARKKTADDDVTVSDDDVFRTWTTFSSVSRHGRSGLLKAVDRAVAAYVTGGMAMLGNHQLNITDLTAVQRAISDWRATKDTVSMRQGAVDRLARLVAERLQTATDALAKRQQDEAEAQRLHGEAHRMDPAMTGFAKRNVVDVKESMFMPSALKAGGIKDALTHRNPDGSLSDEGVRMLDELGEADTEKYRGMGAGAAPQVDAAATPAGIAAAVAAGKMNPRSGRTMDPEAENLTQDLAAGARIEETTTTIQGHTVRYDATDVHRDERLQAVTAALQAVTTAGLAIPPSTEFYLPKYGRKVTVSGDCTYMVSKTGIPDAVFTAPKTVTMSSSNTGNPKDQQVAGVDSFLSTSLGPVGEAMTRSFVHELGHAAHYHHDVRRFHDLSMAAFVPEAEGEDGFSQQTVSDVVSQYGSNNPREMIAEMVLGAIYGKTFTPLLWRAYIALGGPPIATVPESTGG